MTNTPINNAFYNIVANIIKIIVVSLISFAITGILVRELGEELFGVVPLLSSMNKYIGLVTVVLSASVGRFVSLSYFKGKIFEANKYYSSSFFGLLLIAIVAFLCLLVFSFYLEKVFQFPVENYYDVQLFFLLSVGALLVSSLLSTFNVPAFIKHSFYLTDIVGALSKIVQIGFLFFLIGHITLVWFGLSLMLAAIVSLLLTYYFSVRLIPDLRVTIENVFISKLRDMSGMGINSFFNSFGILLYTSSDVIIVNILLGSVESGHYGIAVQCGMTVTLLGGSISRLLAPVIVELIAKDKKYELINYIIRFTKLIVVFSAIPFVVFIGLSKPILYIWLGEGFQSLYLIIICVVCNQLLHQTTSLAFTYFNMKNRLRLPAIMTFITGILNIVLSIVLVMYTDLGIYGVALGTCISIFIKTVGFNVIYASKLLDTSPFLIWKAVLKGLYWPVFVGTVSFFMYELYSSNSIFVLIFSITLLLLIYLVGSLYLPLTSKDRELLIKIFKIDKLKGRIRTS